MRPLFDYWRQHPLRTILLVGLLIRLLSVVYSKGFGMVDDHFVVVKPAQKLLDGTDVGFWYLDKSDGRAFSKRSVLYPGFVYWQFYALEAVGITNPQTKMLFVRLLHALYNLLVPLFGFLIARRLAGERAARIAGLMLALYWWMPILSVRNLNEVVSMPLVMFAGWMGLQTLKESRKWHWPLLLGLALGLAFSVRFQNLFFAGGVGLALLWYRQWRAILWFSLGVVVPIVVVHGLVEGFVFGYPLFGKVMRYIEYNLTNSNSYVNGQWYNYVLLISGILVPPISIFLWAGFIKMRKHLILVLPVLLFLVFHSMFPSKQERFILPMIPLFIAIGVAGWVEIAEKWNWALRHPKIIRGSWVFFWSLNVLALLVVSPAYTKRSRVESMTFLSDTPQHNAFVLEESNRKSSFSVPLYYLGSKAQIYKVFKQTDRAEFCQQVFASPDSLWPNHVLIVTDKKRTERVAQIEECLGPLQLETLIQPSHLDRLLHWLNPVNRNEAIWIYKTSPKAVAPGQQ